ncbi:MAG TPA: hypothetical protein VMY37_14420 [Thermoguttaceae bacterium]|nr:hypothetical protein [Thermoguttaceae bacterium]
MKRALLFACLLFAVAAVSARAAEPKPEAKKVEPQSAAPGQTSKEASAAEEPPAEVTGPVIPERKLVFEETDAKHPMKLFEADAKLLEQRYVAVFRITVDARGPRSSSGNLGGVYVGAVASPGHWFGNLVEKTPKERLPSREVVSILTQNAGRHVLSRTFDDHDAPDGFRVVEFNVLGPTPELVKELVAAILQLYDYGLSYPIQHEYLRLAQQGETLLADLCPELKKADAELAQQKKQLEPYREYEDITEQSLADLMTQRRLLLVDLAGVEARIGACSKILSGPPMNVDRTSRVETIKVSAEIELVGLRARKDYIDHVVEKGRQRQELSAKVEPARKRVDELSSRVSRAGSSLEEYRAQRKRFEPFALESDKITIHPIAWGSPEDGDSRWWER